MGLLLLFAIVAYLCGLFQVVASHGGDAFANTTAAMDSVFEGSATMIPTFSPATTITSIYASTLVVNHTPPILVTRTSTLTHNPAATATMTQVSSLATTVTSTYISTLVVNHGSPVLVTFTSTSTYHPAANPALTKVLTITGLPYTNTVTVTILEVALSRVMTGFCYLDHGQAVEIPCTRTTNAYPALASTWFNNTARPTIQAPIASNLAIPARSNSIKHLSDGVKEHAKAYNLNAAKSFVVEHGKKLLGMRSVEVSKPSLKKTDDPLMYWDPISMTDHPFKTDPLYGKCDAIPYYPWDVALLMAFHVFVWLQVLLYCFYHPGNIRTNLCIVFLVALLGCVFIPFVFWFDAHNDDTREWVHHCVANTTLVFAYEGGMSKVPK